MGIISSFNFLCEQLVFFFLILWLILSVETRSPLAMWGVTYQNSFSIRTNLKNSSNCCVVTEAQSSCLVLMGISLLPTLSQLLKPGHCFNSFRIRCLKPWSIDPMSPLVWTMYQHSTISFPTSLPARLCSRGLVPSHSQMTLFLSLGCLSGTEMPPLCSQIQSLFCDPSHTHGFWLCGLSLPCLTLSTCQLSLFYLLFTGKL